MNVYDFDNTVYDGESTFDFFLYCLRRRPKLVHFLFPVVSGLLRYKMRLVSRADFAALAQKNMFGMLRLCPDYQTLVERFWDANMRKIKPFYRERKQTDDVIMTASFDFLIEPCLVRLGVKHAVCSSADLEAGKVTRLCFRENKPILFDELFPDAKADAFYTDSLNDLPMLKHASRGYYVRGNRVYPLVFDTDGKPHIQKQNK